MSTFAQLRAAWDAWAAAALPDVPATWVLDPRGMELKLPVRLELDGPHTLQNTHDRDGRTYSDTGEELITSHRLGTITLKAISRDHVAHPAELTLERIRIALRRTDLLEGLTAADCSIRRVGPSARYDVRTNGRVESVAAVDVTIGWVFDDAIQTSPAHGVIEIVEGTYDAGTGDVPWGVDGSS